MQKEEVEKLIEIFDKHDVFGPKKYIPEEHEQAEKELLACGSDHIDLLMEQLLKKRWLVSDVIARILGNLSDKRAIPALKKSLKSVFLIIGTT